ncbi:hypothetical protein SAY87_015713 [Trapa incisa]|uniref:Pyruvate dehydrogenase E1 component subunit beta n=1 Tax=Trapa incisa TaxID=236973 RepID=A0AAN7L4R8_9MYRT|nr:hypothetical protein SAY87_015713 [Trapa incisa]
MTVREALNSALDEELSPDPKVFIMGEEISKGLLEKYMPQRGSLIPQLMRRIPCFANLLDSYVQAGITGIGVGVAYFGLKPVFEFMTCRGPNGGAARSWCPTLTTEARDSSFCLPIGKVKIEREGKDMTITAFSKMVGLALKADEILAKEGISAEHISNCGELRVPTWTHQ